MKNTFYRPANADIREFDTIVLKMREDLTELLSGKATETEIKDYVRKLVSDHKLLERNNEMTFWGLDEPQNMPSDCRVMYYFYPTYIAVSFLANALMLYPKIEAEIEGFSVALKKGLLGATGRQFQGSGYDALEGLLDTMELFLEANMQKFISLYPNYSTDFTNQFIKAVDHIKNCHTKGKTFNEFGGDYTQRIAKFLENLGVL